MNDSAPTRLPHGKLPDAATICSLIELGEDAIMRGDFGAVSEPWCTAWDLLMLSVDGMATVSLSAVARATGKRPRELDFWLGEFVEILACDTVADRTRAPLQERVCRQLLASFAAAFPYVALAARQGVGDAMAADGRREDAAKWFRAWIRDQPESASPWVAYAGLYGPVGNVVSFDDNPRRAERTLREGLERVAADEDRRVLLYTLSILLTQAGRDDEAMRLRFDADALQGEAVVEVLVRRLR